MLILISWADSKVPGRHRPLVPAQPLTCFLRMWLGIGESLLLADMFGAVEK